MVVVRLLILLALIAIGAAVVAYLFTRDGRYLGFAWQVLKFAIVFLLAFAALFVLERLLLI